MKKFFLIGALIVVGGVLINYLLGGFKPVKPALISSQSISLYGAYYEGRYNSEALDELIAKLNATLDGSDQKGTLTIINYNQEELEKRGVVKQFVGIEWDAKPVKNTDLDSITIDQYNGVQFIIPIKPLVMPSPEKLKRLAKGMATSMETKLMGLSIEQYKNNKLIINYPFKTH